MSFENVHEHEMRNKRLIGDDQIEAALSGSDGGAEGLSSFVDQVRSAFVAKPRPMDDPRLWEAMDALSPRQPALSRWGFTNPRRVARMTAFLSSLVAKFATMGIGAKAALAAAVATTAVGGAAIATSAPTGTLDLVAPATTTTIAEAVVDTTVGDITVVDTTMAEAEELDASSSSDMSVDDDGDMDASADGDNTVEGAPDELLALLAEHCGIAGGVIPEGVEFDWSADASAGPDGDADASMDFNCEWVDADGCEIGVDFSSDTSEDDEGADQSEDVSVENSCDDEELADDDDISVEDESAVEQDDDDASSVEDVESTDDDHESAEETELEHEEETEIEVDDDHESKDDD